MPWSQLVWSTFRERTSLRNVALTWPYYHDGSVETLEEAVSKMAKFQVGRTMPEDKVLKVKAFLEAQTGVLTEF